MKLIYSQRCDVKEATPSERPRPLRGHARLAQNPSPVNGAQCILGRCVRLDPDVMRTWSTSLRGPVHDGKRVVATLNLVCRLSVGLIWRLLSCIIKIIHTFIFILLYLYVYIHTFIFIQRLYSYVYIHTFIFIRLYSYVYIYTTFIFIRLYLYKGYIDTFIFI